MLKKTTFIISIQCLSQLLPVIAAAVVVVDSAVLFFFAAVVVLVATAGTVIVFLHAQAADVFNFAVISPSAGFVNADALRLTPIHS